MEPERNSGLKNNFLFYFSDKNREYKKIKVILNKFEIEHKQVRLTDERITKEFIESILEYCQNGFDDIVKNVNKVSRDKKYDDFKYSEMIAFIIEHKQEILKPVFFLGKNGVVTSKTYDEDEFTIHIPYYKREMSKIYE